MKRAIIKGVLLGCIFALALMILSRVMNQGNTDMTTEMGEATYPVLSMYVDAYRVGSLHGYAQAMECAYLRDNLQPIGEDRKDRCKDGYLRTGNRYHCLRGEEP